MIAVFDLETGSPRDSDSGDIIKDGNVMQIGVTVTDYKFNELGKYYSNVIPHTKPTDEALEVNGLYNYKSFTKTGLMASRELIDFLKSFNRELILCSHNIDFDRPQLLEFLARNGFAIEIKNIIIPTQSICTLRLAQFLYRKNVISIGKHNLGHLTNKLDIKMIKAHDAISDAYACRDLLKKLYPLLVKYYNEKENDVIKQNPLKDFRYFMQSPDGLYIPMNAMMNRRRMEFILKSLYARYVLIKDPYGLER